MPKVDLQPFNLNRSKSSFLRSASSSSKTLDLNFDIGDQDQLFFSRQIGIDPLTGQKVPINGRSQTNGNDCRTQWALWR